MVYKPANCPIEVDISDDIGDITLNFNDTEILPFCHPELGQIYKQVLFAGPDIAATAFYDCFMNPVVVDESELTPGFCAEKQKKYEVRCDRRCIVEDGVNKEEIFVYTCLDLEENTVVSTSQYTLSLHTSSLIPWEGDATQLQACACIEPEICEKGEIYCAREVEIFIDNHQFGERPLGQIAWRMDEHDFNVVMSDGSTLSGSDGGGYAGWPQQLDGWAVALTNLIGIPLVRDTASSDGDITTPFGNYVSGRICPDDVYPVSITVEVTDSPRPGRIGAIKQLLVGTRILDEKEYIRCTCCGGGDVWHEVGAEEPTEIEDLLTCISKSCDWPASPTVPEPLCTVETLQVCEITPEDGSDPDNVIDAEIVETGIFLNISLCDGEITSEAYTLDEDGEPVEHVLTTGNYYGDCDTLEPIDSKPDECPDCELTKTKYMIHAAPLDNNGWSGAGNNWGLIRPTWDNVGIEVTLNDGSTFSFVQTASPNAFVQLEKWADAFRDHFDYCNVGIYCDNWAGCSRSPYPNAPSVLGWDTDLAFGNYLYVEACDPAKLPVKAEVISGANAVGAVRDTTATTTGPHYAYVCVGCKSKFATNCDGDPIEPPCCCEEPGLFDDFTAECDLFDIDAIGYENKSQIYTAGQGAGIWDTATYGVVPAGFEGYNYAIGITGAPTGSTYNWEISSDNINWIDFSSIAGTPDGTLSCLNQETAATTGVSSALPDEINLVAYARVTVVSPCGGSALFTFETNNNPVAPFQPAWWATEHNPNVDLLSVELLSPCSEVTKSLRVQLDECSIEALNRKCLTPIAGNSKCYGAGNGDDQYANSDNDTDISFSIGSINNGVIKWEVSGTNDDQSGDFTASVVACIESGNTAVITITDSVGNVYVYNADTVLGSGNADGTGTWAFGGNATAGGSGKVSTAVLTCGALSSGEAYSFYNCDTGTIVWLDSVTNQPLSDEQAATISNCEECEVSNFQTVVCATEQITDSTAGNIDIGDYVLVIGTIDCNNVILQAVRYLVDNGSEITDTLATEQCDPSPDVEEIRECIIDEKGNRWTQIIVVDAQDPMAPIVVGEFFYDNNLVIGTPTGDPSTWTACPNDSLLQQINKVCFEWLGEYYKGYQFVYSDGGVQYGITADPSRTITGVNLVCCDDCIQVFGCRDGRLAWPAGSTVTMSNGDVLDISGLRYGQVARLIVDTYGGTYNAPSLGGPGGANFSQCQGSSQHELQFFNLPVDIESIDEMTSYGKFGECEEQFDCCDEEIWEELDCQTCSVVTSEVISSNGTFSLTSGGDVTVAGFPTRSYTGVSQGGCGEALAAGPWSTFGTTPVVLTFSQPVTGVRLHFGNVNSLEEVTLSPSGDCNNGVACSGIVFTNDGFTASATHAISSHIIDYGFDTPISSLTVQHNGLGSEALGRIEILNCKTGGNVQPSKREGTVETVNAGSVRISGIETIEVGDTLNFYRIDEGSSAEYLEFTSVVTGVTKNKDGTFTAKLDGDLSSVKEGYKVINVGKTGTGEGKK